MIKRIELPNDNWADVKTSWDVTRKERRDLFATFSATDEVDSDAAALQLMITAWSFPEPINVESIDNLPVPIVNALMKDCVQFVRELSPNFTPDDGGIEDPKAPTDKPDNSEQ